MCLVTALVCAFATVLATLDIIVYHISRWIYTPTGSGWWAVENTTRLTDLILHPIWLFENMPKSIHLDHTTFFVEVIELVNR